ncbi:tetratricopeptide repeat protein [Mucilaginibacter segetis]|uniref:Tetratricopeptide repeat protein n=1 Tax=Mucilaginibacter segetis TaxID=2793071 RepID=A0A934PU69_9SPHI|nr:hypothetical protein [Mucilaginibacter segetis]MBK0379093.1 hypothetical protein [Mucilaginibacter segetis]
MHSIQAKKILWLISLVFFCTTLSYGNIHAIDFNKISYPKNLEQELSFLKNNDTLYNHWTHNWTYDISKGDAIKNLNLIYTVLDKNSEKNTETYLLLGDIAHYLYNMEVEKYYQLAIDNYQKALKLSPADYRVYWFLGNHYSLSSLPVLAIDTYQKAFKAKPKNINSLLWADYSIACLNAGMTSNAAYYAHKYSLSVNDETSLEKQTINVIEQRLKATPVDTTLSTKDIWTFNKRENKLLSFSNWSLGLQVNVDSTWQVDAGDYKNRTSYFIIKPNTEKTINGKEIGYSMLLLMRSPDEATSLSDFMDLFAPKTDNRKPISIKVAGFNNALAYEIKDPSVYSDMGGGHFITIALERDDPDYPGMKLEIPVEYPKGESGKINYYKVPQQYTRIKGKIYYLVLLDTCENIFNKSFKVFENFITNNLLIE